MCLSDNARTIWKVLYQSSKLSLLFATVSSFTFIETELKVYYYLVLLLLLFATFFLVGNLLVLGITYLIAQVRRVPFVTTYYTESDIKTLDFLTKVFIFVFRLLGYVTVTLFALDIVSVALDKPRAQDGEDFPFDHRSAIYLIVSVIIIWTIYSLRNHVKKEKNMNINEKEKEGQNRQSCADVLGNEHKGDGDKISAPCSTICWDNIAAFGIYLLFALVTVGFYVIARKKGQTTMVNIDMKHLTNTSHRP